MKLTAKEQRTMDQAAEIMRRVAEHNGEDVVMGVRPVGTFWIECDGEPIEGDIGDDSTTQPGIALMVFAQ